MSGGLVNFSAANNFGTTGQVTLNGGGLQWATGTTTDISSRLANLGGGGGTLDTNGNSVTLATAIGGGGGLTKTGLGALTLATANGYTGGTAINGGAISISANANLGDAAGTLALGGGTLQTTATLTMSRATTLNGGGGTFDTASSTTLTHSGDIGGTGGLTKSGAGTLVLGGDQQLRRRHDGVGRHPGGHDLDPAGRHHQQRQRHLRPGTTGTYAGVIGGSGSLTKAGTGTTILTGTRPMAAARRSTAASCRSARPAARRARSAARRPSMARQPGLRFDQLGGSLAIANTGGAVAFQATARRHTHHQHASARRLRRPQRHVGSTVNAAAAMPHRHGGSATAPSTPAAHSATVGTAISPCGGTFDLRLGAGTTAGRSGAGTHAAALTVGQRHDLGGGVIARRGGTAR